MGNVNSYRLLVSWRFCSKLNNIRPSVLGLNAMSDVSKVAMRRGATRSEVASESQQDVKKIKTTVGTKLIFDGFTHANDREIKCIDDSELFDQLCCNNLDLEDTELISRLLLQKRVFHTFRQQVQNEKWDRFISENPAKQWWEETTASPAGPPPVKRATVTELAREEAGGISPTASVDEDQKRLNEGAAVILQVLRLRECLIMPQNIIDNSDCLHTCSARFAGILGGSPFFSRL
jgi:hypothetical protein